MPKFVLIDHSIADWGGHHFEYAKRVLRAADLAGYEPILATNRRLSRVGPLSWRVLPAYRYGYWFAARALPAAGTLHRIGRCVSRCRWPKKLCQRAFAWRKRLAFGADSLRLFGQIHVGQGDVVFIPTLAEPEMLGLLRVFERNPAAAHASWHLLFRRNIFVGREPDYLAQDEKLRPLGTALRRFIQRTAGARVYFYTDTERLTAQYNRLGVARFETLPIPADEGFRAQGAGFSDAPADTGQTTDCVSPPLRASVEPAARVTAACRASTTAGATRRWHIVYLGDARTEKGYHHLPRLVAELTADGPPVQFSFQSNFNVPGGEPAAAAARAQLERLPRDQVRLLNDPMTSADYRALLLDADVVVLPYDRDDYYARSSGIFAEALAIGKPVVVPAGTWMAAELSRAGRYYQAALPPMAGNADTSVVGAVYSDPRDLASQVRQVLGQYDHYSATAADFSHGWSSYHSAQTLVKQLVLHAAA